MKRKKAKVKHTQHKQTRPHELTFALSLAIMISLLGLYAFVQMYTFRVAAAPHP